MILRTSTRALIVATLLGLAGCVSVPNGQVDAEQSARINTQLGVTYMRQNRLEQAYDKLQKALRQDPGFAEAHGAIAVLYERMKEPAKAREHHQRAVELAPQESTSLNNYGRFLCAHGEYREAEASFKRAAENPLYRNSEVPWTNAGSCAQSAGDIEKAERFFLSALRANPRFAPALLQVARIRQDAGHSLSARGFYQRYLAVAAQTPESLWLGIEIERSMNDGGAAASYALLLKGRYPDSDEARRLIAVEKQNER